MTFLNEIITFNIFTNCCLSSPNPEHMKLLIESIQNIFNLQLSDFTFNVLVDHHPYSDRYDDFVNNIQILLNNFGITNFSIYKTEGLSFSHNKTIEITKTPLSFHLEHDFIFNNNVKHSLYELCNVLLNNDDVECIQFGLRKRHLRNQHFGLEEDEKNNIKFCKTKYLSNIPHIIKIECVKERMKYARFIVGSSGGIEYDISQKKIFTNHLYGPLGYRATINHTDGRTTKL